MLLTQRQLWAVLLAVGQMTDGNARDIDEMMLCGLTQDEARALLEAEVKLLSLYNKRKQGD